MKTAIWNSDAMSSKNIFSICKKPMEFIFCGVCLLLLSAHSFFRLLPCVVVLFCIVCYCMCLLAFLHAFACFFFFFSFFLRYFAHAEMCVCHVNLVYRNRPKQRSIYTLLPHIYTYKYVLHTLKSSAIWRSWLTINQRMKNEPIFFCFVKFLLPYQTFAAKKREIERHE